ncbi:MAG: Dam family site-specific DNA-(adenine-N6)-methyltransferase [Clostridia bacterium]|nr:Dam family site-specific DNA-(adenine-N6)-methyltransferase [Clostridia bacterium]MDD4387018.1 Dam family site-specific DNA-(adenine-N6)-methyltransferase [Clostridia bacterium]
MKRLDINNRRYLGSKYKLLDFIDSIVEEKCKDYETVLDVFAGTGIVAAHFARKGKTVYLNDILKSNYCIHDAWFGTQTIDMKKTDNFIEEYNTNKYFNENYFWKVYKDTYFSSNDCKKIGSIREDIEQKQNNQIINEREKNILIASLIYSMDKIANTVGHYDAYRKKQKLEDKFVMFGLNIPKASKKENKVFNIDSNKLVENLQADILYIDPPYNSRQYGDAYHLLENIAEWKQPKVHGVAKKMNRDDIKSEYCTRKAANAFKELIRHCKAKYILVSYNNMGVKGNSRSQAKISDVEILEILNQKGKVKVYEKDFGYFTTGKSKIKNHKERVFFCEVMEKTCEEKVPQLISNDNFAKSPLNYVGGKFRLLGQLISKLPSIINTFVDFFCGAVNVGANINAKKIIAIDKEKCLLDVLKLFKSYKYTEIIDKLDEIIKNYGLSNTYLNGYKYYDCNSSSGLGKFNKDGYLRLRKDYNNPICLEKDEKTFMFLTLIIYGFNHQIRFNSEGKFNMPVGKRDFNSSIRKNLLGFCQKLQTKEISFVASDFRKFNIDSLEKDDLCYFDPPYYLGNASYNENNGWTEKDEKDLLAYIKKIDDKKVNFAFSNVLEHKGKKHQMLIDWAIENQYNINYLDYNYNNSNYQSNNKDNITREVLITNY